MKKANSELSRIRSLERKGKKIVFTNGCFDLIHPGHIRFLRQAKAKGDVLVVGLNSDASVRRLKGPKRPILGLKERREVLSSLKPVDFVLSFPEDTPFRLIQKVRPHVLIKGGDWRKGTIVGGEWIKARGGKVLSGLYLRGNSTSQVIKKIRT